jgi:membrane dipeptidase
VQGNVAVQELGNDNAKAAPMLHDWWTSMRDRGVPGYGELPRHMVIPELNDARRMFTIQRALEQAGFAASEVEKIVGGNWLRVLEASLP